jgi:hypothetical protein
MSNWKAPNNSNRFSRNYQGDGRYKRTNNNSTWSSNGGNRELPQKKHSGCTTGLTKKTNAHEGGKPYVQGWKYDKRNGLRKFFASGYASTTCGVSPSTGTKYETWVVKITLADGSSLIRPCMYYPETRRVVIRELGFVMSPKGGRGGYIGKF